MKTLCLAQKGHKSKEEFANDENRSRGRSRGQRGKYKGRGEDLIKERSNVIDVEKLVILHVIVEFHGRKLLTRKRKYKKKGTIKVILLNLHIMLLHIVILELKNILVLSFLEMTFVIKYWSHMPYEI